MEILGENIDMTTEKATRKRLTVSDNGNGSTTSHAQREYPTVWRYRSKTSSFKTLLWMKINRILFDTLDRMHQS